MGSKRGGNAPKASFLRCPFGLGSGHPECSQVLAPELGRMATETRHDRVAVDQQAAKRIRRRVPLVAGVDRVEPSATFQTTFAIDLPERPRSRRPAGHPAGGQVDCRWADFANGGKSQAKKMDRPDIGAVILKGGDGAQSALRRQRDQLTACGAGKAINEIPVAHPHLQARESRTRRLPEWIRTRSPPRHSGASGAWMLVVEQLKTVDFVRITSGIDKIETFCASILTWPGRIQGRRSRHGVVGGSEESIRPASKSPDATAFLSGHQSRKRSEPT